MYMCVSGFASIIFLLDIGNVPTVSYLLFFILLDNFIALCISKILWGGWKGVRRGRYCMVVGFTTNCAITTYHY